MRGTSEDCIDMNNYRALLGEIDNPHASILIQWIKDMIIQIIENTGVVNILISEREEKGDMAYIKAQHTLDLTVSANKHHVIARWHISPW